MTDRQFLTSRDTLGEAMSAPNVWPDASKPGVPMNPQRDGWHWVRTPDGEDAPYQWRAAGECERGRWDARWVFEPVQEWDPLLGTYLGPCLTPAEVAAREEAAYHQGWGDREDDFIAGTERSGLIVISSADLAAREAAAVMAMRDAGVAYAKKHSAMLAAQEIALLPLPAPDALARALAAAERRGMEKGHNDALRWALALQQIQEAAAAALERGPGSELFALLHRVAASALASDEPTRDEKSAAIRAALKELPNA